MGLLSQLFGAPAPATTTYLESGPALLGKRVRFLEEPLLTEKWKALFPLVTWWPVKGDIGVVLELPGALGGGPKVRWEGKVDEEGKPRESWVSAGAPLEVLG